MEQAPQIADEALDARALRRRNVAKPVGEIDDAESCVAGVVAQRERDQLAHQRIGAVVLKALEQADGDPLEEDLHADDLLAVMVRLEQAMDQLLERRGERRVEPQRLWT